MSREMGQSISKHLLLRVLAVIFFGAALIGVVACRSEGEKKGSEKKPKKKKNGSIAVTEEGVFIRQRGRWQSGSPSLDELEQKQLEKLGYLTGYESRARAGGVTIHEDAAYKGYNLYTSGHGPVATLMDMKGKTIHKWKFDPKSEFLLPNYDKRRIMGLKYMRRAHLFPNGDLLALYDYVGLVKLDKNSKKYWFKDAYYHHDIFIGKSGEIYTFEDVKVDGSSLGFEYDIIDNFIVIMNTNGEVQKKISLAKCFKRSLSEKEIRDIFNKTVLSRVHKGDVFHANSIEVIEGGLEDRHSAFKKGNVLVSMRSTNTIAVIDIKKETVELHFSGDWIHQHEASLQRDGKILFFDNKGKKTYSRILEVDPSTLKKVWTYTARPKNAFYSRLQGVVNRLPNGNTLVIESTWGRAFELDKDSKIVWEYISPRRAAHDDELIAVLFDLTRIKPDFPMEWLKTKGEQN